MQEEDISDDSGLDGLGWARSNAVEYASAHEAVICGCSSTPDHGCEADSLGKDVYRAAAESGADGNPDEVRETKDKDANTRELHGLRKGAVESLHVVRELWCEGEWPEALCECHPG